MTDNTEAPFGEQVIKQMEAVTESVAQMTASLRASAAPHITSTIRTDTGGMAMIVAGASAAIAIFAMVGLVCVLVWATDRFADFRGQITELRNKDAVHDAYLDQHKTMIHKLEKTK